MWSLFMLGAMDSVSVQTADWRRVHGRAPPVVPLYQHWEALRCYNRMRMASYAPPARSTHVINTYKAVSD